MTREQYSKATDIMIQIQHYQDIVDVFKNMKGRELCCRDMKDLTIVNSVHIMDEPIRMQLIHLVEEEIRELEIEFNKI